MDKRFIVSFTRMGNVVSRPFQFSFVAPSVAELEAPITDFVSEYTEDPTVTISPELMNGQVNYGLFSNFTIAEA